MTPVIMHLMCVHVLRKLTSPNYNIRHQNIIAFCEVEGGVQLYEKGKKKWPKGVRTSVSFLLSACIIHNYWNLKRNNLSRPTYIATLSQQT